MNKFIKAAICVIIILISSLFSSKIINSYHNWGGDFAQYILQAKSISQGNTQKFYKDNCYAMDNSSNQGYPYSYPWFYPLVLSVVNDFSDFNIYHLKIINVIFYSLLLIILIVLFKKNHNFYWLIILLCFFAFNPYLLTYLNNIFADIPFLFLSTFSIFLIDRIIIKNLKIFTFTIDRILLGIIIALAFNTRSNGILLLIVLLIAQFSEFKHKNWINLRNFFPKFIPLISFLIINFIFYICFPNGETSYLLYFKRLTPEIVINNFSFYFTALSGFYSPIFFSKLIYYITLPFLFLGIKKRINQEYPTLLYAVLTLGLLVVWPAQATRFIFPILPFYISYTITGIEGVYHKLNKFWGSLLKYLSLTTSVAIILLLFTDVYRHSYKSPKTNGPLSTMSQEMFTFINKNTNHDDIIAFFKPRVMRLFSDRQSLRIELAPHLNRVDYLCIYQNTENHQISMEQIEFFINNGMIKKIYENKDFLIYQVIQITLES